MKKMFLFLLSLIFVLFPSNSYGVMTDDQLATLLQNNYTAIGVTSSKPYLIPLANGINQAAGGGSSYPLAGIALSTGSAWGTSITNNSTNWNTAYGWGNHASAGYLTSITTSTPTNGTGFLKGNGSVISFDNSTYLTSLSGACLLDQSTPQTIGDTTNRLLKLWATDITVTNAITGSVTGNAGTATSAGKSTNLIGGNSTTLLGSIPYQSNTDTTTLLGPNTTTTKKFLSMTGTGSNGAVPAWDVATGGHTIQDESTPLTQRTNLNFIGQAVTVTDDVGNDATKVTINFNDSDAPIGSFLSHAGIDPPTNYILANGAAISRTTYADLYNVLTKNKGTVTISIASPGEITLATHGLVTGDTIELTTTSALPTGLSVNTNYYVIYENANTFWLATSYANAIAGTKINTSGSQSGVHSLRYCPWGISTATNFLLPDARAASIRGAGTSTAFTSNATIALGQIINDQFQGHYHRVERADSPSIGPNEDPTGTTGGNWTIKGGSQTGTYVYQAGSLTDDGTNGTPRKGLETTGKAIGAFIYIKYTRQTVTAVGETFTNSIVAYAGGGQASAVELTTNINIITTCATSLDSVKLYSSIAVGFRQRVINKGTKILALYPASGHSIESLSANTPIPVLPGNTVELVAISTTNWTLEIGAIQKTKQVDLSSLITVVAGYGTLNSVTRAVARLEFETLTYAASNTTGMRLTDININLVFASAGIGSRSVHIAGLTFLNVTNLAQSLIGDTGGTNTVLETQPIPNTDELFWQLPNAYTHTGINCSGNVEIQAQTLI